MEPTSNTDELNFKDRSGWLTVFGIFELLSAFFIGLTKLHSVHSMRATSANAVVAYSLAIGIFEIAKRVILGWGSIKARRWARSLLLVSSWFSLGVGIVVCPFMYWMMNHLPINDARVTPRFRMVMSLAVTAFTFVFAVLVPYVFVMFYRREDVKKTCEERNPSSSWTDACPLPVLGMSLLLLLGAVPMSLSAFLPHARIPILIWMVGGAPAKIVIAFWATATAYVSYLLYRLSMKGFWLAAALMGAGLINGTVFYAAKGWDGFMSLLGENMFFQKDMQSIMLLIKPAINIMMIGSVVGFAIYLIFLKKKYFTV